MAEASVEGREQIPQEQAVARRVRPRSAVWEHFTHFTTVDGKSKAECNRCHRVFIALTKNGTSTLRRHVGKCQGPSGTGAGDLDQLITNVDWDLPPVPCDPALLTPCDPPSSLPCPDLPMPLTSDLPSTLPHIDPPPPFPCDPPPLLPCTDPPPQFPCAPSQHDDELPDSEPALGEEARKHLARLITLHGFDPLLLEDDCFRSFVKSLNPEFKLPSRFINEEMCDDIFDEARKDLLSRLNRSNNKVSLAVGTTNTIHGEVLYTACHFIDDEWNLNKIVLDAYLVAPFPIFYGPLLGVPETTLCDLSDQAGKSIWASISDHNIFERLFAVVWAKRYDDRIMRILKHIISTDFVTFMDTSLHSIVETSTTLNPNFTLDMYGKLHGLDLTREERQQHFSHIGLDHLLLYGKHWYSCYCSLEFLRKHDSCTFADKDKSQLIELLCKIWGGTYHAIQRISTLSYSTSSECLVVLFKVRVILQSELEQVDGNDSIAYSGAFFQDKDVADVLREAMGTLNKIIESSYLVWSVPLVLDPRYKLRYIKFIFSGAFGSGGARYIFEVTRKIKKLYADYVEFECDGGINGATDQMASGSSADPLGQAWDEHCRSRNEVDGVSIDRGAAEELYRSLEGLAIGSRADPLGQAWRERCHSGDGMDDVGSGLEAEKELDRYLKDPCEAPTEGFDILNWWKVNSQKYPTVARMARDALAMPTCSKLSSEQMAHVSSIVRGYSKNTYRKSKYERDDTADHTSDEN